MSPIPRVLYDFDIFNRQRYGGVGRYFIELIRHMTPDLANVRLCAGLHINAMLQNSFPGSGIVLPACPKTAIIREIINQHWLNRVCRRWRPQILHKTLYCMQKPPPGVKLVITLHDLASARFPEYFGGRDTQTPMVRYWAERADALVAISETTRRDAIEILGVPPQRITVVRHGIDPPKPTGRQHAQRPHGPDYLLYVGQRYPYKNFRNLVRAYARTIHTRKAFELVCFGGGEFSREEKFFLAECGAGDRVHVRSGGDSALLDYYLHAGALVVPSIYEGFGLPLLEAMSTGCPVLASDIPTTREIAGDWAVYFPAQDVDGIAAVLERAPFDEGLLARNVAAGRERAADFSWSKCASETAAVYRSLGVGCTD